MPRWMPASLIKEPFDAKLFRIHSFLDGLAQQACLLGFAGHG